MRSERAVLDRVDKFLIQMAERIRNEPRSRR